MVQCGFQRLLRDGLLITMATGSGLSRGAGPGSTTRLGVMHPATTAGGCMPADSGHGHQDRWWSRGPFMRPRWWLGWEVRTSALDFHSAQVVAWDGSLSDGVSPMFPR